MVLRTRECRVNGNLLKNFLDALALSDIKPKRFILQTGAKYYGSHTGPLKVPQEEWDPRVLLEPNFYYDQEDILWDYHKRSSVEWGIVMPAAILGAVPDAAMNLCFPLAIYANVYMVPRESSTSKFSLTKWAKRKEVQQASVELAAKHGLVCKEIQDIDRNFGFLDWALCQSEPFVTEISKMIPAVPKKKVAFL
ncbi:hypothetical protein NW754_001396 [Fusarium falciforme]|nr:hypothetical protein NW754_001396 [Fusarium falciforme]